MTTSRIPGRDARRRRARRYYDTSARCDMVPNHLFHCFADRHGAPSSLEADAIATSRSRCSARSAARQPTGARTVRTGQERPAIATSERGEDSRTRRSWRCGSIETAVGRLPFYLRTGKRWTAVIPRSPFQFRRPPTCCSEYADRPARQPAGAGHPGRGGVSLRFGAKVPGRSCARIVTMDLTTRGVRRSPHAPLRALLTIA